jgi:hypothetical protein
MSDLKALGLILLLLTACVGLPAVVARFSSPWLGLLTAAFALWIWNRLVPPGPGYGQGIVWLFGCAMIISLVIGLCIVLILR